jgi:two-component system chemotaxis response regulator CheB
MGKDGAAGMLELRRAGAYTYAQDKESCVVYGMPKEAVAVGAVEEVLPLDAIAEAVLGRLAMSGASLNRV